MKNQKLVGVTALSLALLALGACHKNADAKAASGIENSSGSYAPNTPDVPGTSTDSTGVGTTGVPAEDIAKPPSASTPAPTP